MLTILIRTSNRPEHFARCLKSVLDQTYDKIRVIVSYDRRSALKYIPENIQTIRVDGDRSQKYFYDTYCNALKSLVTEGHFMFLDDDDYLAGNDVINEIAGYFTWDAIICQYQRKGLKFPPDAKVVSGKIGMPCLILHSKYRDLADIPGRGVGDYLWIKAVTAEVPYMFVPLVVSTGEQRSYGKYLKKL